MDNGLKVRQILFESLLEEGKKKEKWEKLCCSNRPLVPCVGAARERTRKSPAPTSENSSCIYQE